MPSTHLSIRCHIVFSTKDRRPWIVPAWRPRLHAYLGGIARNLDAAPLAVGGVEDHVHLLLGLRATHRLSDLMREIKHDSSRWVHEIGCLGFGWQDGYGAFSVGPSELDSIRHYIAAQEAHHRKATFQEEYRELLREHGVEFDERYLW
jgi:putative transposase